MIRKLALALGLLGGVAACVPAGNNGFSPGVSDIAAQRMRFAAEAVCLNNRSRAAQRRSAQNLNFPVRERDGDATVYINPGTLTFIRIGPAPAQSFTNAAGQRQIVQGNGCSVGSPAVGTNLANKLAGEILAPRLVDGSDTLLAPLGAGTNEDGGVGFFFDNLSVTLPVARTTFTDPDTGEGVAFNHPVILVIHN
ncbi:hypothetical protein [Jannaschia pohangensis]|uniref:Prepilin-type processing-associated H-X9-DG domain-containing protein n=1 Tax=Jannaschia pohangensis TaxID=390807 RepID=A0A1I3R1R0_9RHOB|nr:hypothetical protein [Jannaschia pohangensis]SFJ39649.1 hypothetical protein SAMN04488095_2736 [Jannaschia pohangensis]